MVSDGMSIGTLTLADMYTQSAMGKHTTWVENYKNGRFKRAMMDTASASSLVTDSAAGGSAWGGGVRVPNGTLNVGANGEQYTPILDRKSTRLNSSHVRISYAVFCLKKKTLGR